MSDEEELKILDGEDPGDFYRRQILHRDTKAYKIISITFGLFFFIGSIIFFLIDAKKYLAPILFYDIVGTIMLVYGLNLNEFEHEKKSKEEKMEDLKSNLNNKKFEYQF